MIRQTQAITGDLGARLLTFLVAACLSVSVIALSAPTAHAASSADATIVLKRGDRGEKVRVLEARLAQLKLAPALTTGWYDETVVNGVKAFQKRNGHFASGRLTLRAWKLLQKQTTEPTPPQIWTMKVWGKPLITQGSPEIRVRRMQARLKQIGWYSGDVTGVYGPTTVASVKGFQKKRHIPVTGQIDSRTVRLIRNMTKEPTRQLLYNIVPAGLDKRCMMGRVLCIDKTSRSLRWMIDGHVLKRVDVRFGSDELPTREGTFSVFSKSRDHISSLYHTSMPFAMFFSGGQAVHYSPDFAATGYSGASHGCVNVRDYNAIQWLFDTQVRLGDKVVIYRS